MYPYSDYGMFNYKWYATIPTNITHFCYYNVDISWGTFAIKYHNDKIGYYSLLRLICTLDKVVKRWLLILQQPNTYG